MKRHLLVLTVPVLVLAVFALVRGITSLRALRARSELAVLPVAPESVLRMPGPGEIHLALRGSLGTRAFSAASFRLLDDQGHEVPLRPLAMRSQRTSLAGETTLAVGSFEIPAAGTYRLVSQGLEVTPADPSLRLVLQRPGGAALVARLLWVVGAALLVVASLVLSLVALTRANPPRP